MPKLIEQISNWDIGITNDINCSMILKKWNDSIFFSEPWILKVNKSLDNLSSTLDDESKDMIKYNLNASTYWLLTRDSINIVTLWGSVFKAHDVEWTGSDLKVFKDDMYWSGDINGIWKTITTLLDWSITDTDTTITVDSTTGYPTAWDLVIESEVITYTWTTATTFTGCTRWVNSSIAASHSDNRITLWFIDNFQAFSVNFSSWGKGKHMKIFNNRLYACDWNSLSEWDGTVLDK